jgi:hypothetical protein
LHPIAEIALKKALHSSSEGVISRVPEEKLPPTGLFEEDLFTVPACIAGKN